MRASNQNALNARLNFVWVATTYDPDDKSVDTVTNRRYVARGSEGAWGVFDRFEDRYISFEELAMLNYSQLGSDIGYA